MADGGAYLGAILAEPNQSRKQWKRGDKILVAFGYTRRRESAVDLINQVLATLAAPMHLSDGLTASRAITVARNLSPERSAAGSRACYADGTRACKTPHGSRVGPAAQTGQMVMRLQAIRVPDEKTLQSALTVLDALGTEAPVSYDVVADLRTARPILVVPQWLYGRLTACLNREGLPFEEVPSRSFADLPAEKQAELRRSRFAGTVGGRAGA